MQAFLSISEFKEVLIDYGNRTKKDNGGYVYDRIPYGIWKDLKANFWGKCVTLETSGWVDDEVIISTNDGHKHTFYASDDAFGMYLCEFYLDGKNKALSRKIVHNIDGSVMVVQEREDGTSRYFDMSTLAEDVKKLKADKESEEMRGFNFDFGPCTNDNVRMSMYGLAVQNNAGVWVSYNSKAGEIIDVDILNFDGRKYMFKMPVATKEVAVGDIIVHNRVPMFVIGTDEGIVAVDPRAGEEKKIIPTTNMFGFNFVTKIVSMFDAVGQAPTPDNPFGNMLPLMLMSDDGKGFDPMMLMLMMNSNGSTSTGFDMSNPMMLYFLMGKDGKGSDMLPLMMMMNTNQKPTHKCNCGHHNE